MEQITLICECCHQAYNTDTIAKSGLCPPCKEQWDKECHRQEDEDWNREQEEIYLEMQGVLVEDEDDPDTGWLCEICGDPIYDCGHLVCGHCGDALSHDQIGVYDTCPNCEYELEHPYDEIEYDDISQVYDPNFP